jgi:putative tricarboxylic transport membrane protein
MAPGSLVPLLTLGIPGSPPAAVILGALMLHGMRPGVELFTVHASITYAFIMGLLVAAFLVTIIGSLGSFIFARIINIPARFLAPAIIFMTVLGSYSIRNNMVDVWIMFIFGIIGPFVEEGLVQSMLAGGASGSVLSYMVLRPISGVLIALCLMSALWPLFASWRAKRKSACACETEVNDV